MIEKIILSYFLLFLFGEEDLDAIFKKAILDKSNEPYFVLITLINDSTKSKQLIAIEAPFLLGAIHIEHSIPHSEAGMKKVQSIALSNKKRIFRFKKSQAIKNIGIFYNANILTAMKEKFDNLDKETLVEQLKNFDSDLHRIYQGQSRGLYISYRNAIAHILLEKGISVRRSSKTGNLFTM